MGEVEVRALQGVDLTLTQGEFVVILGPSGSGKSTLLNILGALDVPTAGSLTFQDHDLTAGDDASRTAYRRNHVGFVFQFYNLLPALTAAENVAAVADIARDARKPWPWLASLIAVTTFLPNSPAGNNSGWLWLGPSSNAPRFYSVTSQPGRLTRRLALSCSMPLSESVRNWARPRF